MKEVAIRDNLDARQICFAQIKEKFGGLRVYMDCSTAGIDSAISEAVSRAATTCEKCGKPGTLRQQYGVRTYCDDCDRAYVAWQEERRAERKRKESMQTIVDSNN